MLPLPGSHNKSLVWSVSDCLLYNEAFTGRVSAIPVCKHCLGKNHAISNCNCLDCQQTWPVVIIKSLLDHNLQDHLLSSANCSIKSSAEAGDVSINVDATSAHCLTPLQHAPNQNGYQRQSHPFLPAEGQRCLKPLVKMAIKSAHRVMPVHPQDRPLLLRADWQGAVHIDTMLPFELHSAQKNFTSLVDALQLVLQDRGATFFWHYLNDFIVCGPPAFLDYHRFLLTRIATSCHMHNNLGYRI